MKKIISSFPFLALTIGGGAIAVASVGGAFEACGVCTELFMLSIGFLIAVLGIYATAKTMSVS